NIIGAQQWQNEILSALQRCDWFVVLLSPDAINSMWVKREVAFALQDPRYEDRIIPLKYRDCDLKSLQWLTPTATSIFDMRATTPYVPPAYLVYPQEATYVTSLPDQWGRLYHSHL